MGGKGYYVHVLDSAQALLDLQAVADIPVAPEAPAQRNYSMQFEFKEPSTLT